VINLDKDGNPLRPAIVWLDQRRYSWLKTSRGFVGALISTHRNDKNCRVFTGRSGKQLVQQYQPEIWAKTYSIYSYQVILTYKLTGFIY